MEITTWLPTTISAAGVCGVFCVGGAASMSGFLTGATDAAAAASAASPCGSSSTVWCDG